MLMAEINTYWASIPAEHQWSEQLDSKLNQGKKTTLAYNPKDSCI
jgi:hypothetical protein